MNKTIYLAGSITGSSYHDAMEWRHYVKDNLESWVCLNPLNGEPHDVNCPSLPMCDPTNYSLTDQAITGKDYFYLQQSSVVLANMTIRPISYPMIGTTLEIGYATALNKLVYVVAEKNSEWSNHPMITSRCIIVPQLDIALKMIRAL